MTSRPQWNPWTFWHLLFLLILQLINSCLWSTLKLWKRLILFFFLWLTILNSHELRIKGFLSLWSEIRLTKDWQTVSTFQSMPSQFWLNFVTHWMKHSEDATSPKPTATMNPSRNCHLRHNWTPKVHARSILRSCRTATCGIWLAFAWSASYCTVQEEPNSANLDCLQ